jgi:hypothetical protein
LANQWNEYSKLGKAVYPGQDESEKKLLMRNTQYLLSSLGNVSGTGYYSDKTSTKQSKDENKDLTVGKDRLILTVHADEYWTEKALEGDH